MTYSHCHWLVRAAELLEQEAERIRDCHTVAGKWDGSEPEAKDEHDELLAAAQAVRVEVEKQR